jgi:hypothetical protein
VDPEEEKNNVLEKAHLDRGIASPLPPPENISIF